MPETICRQPRRLPARRFGGRARAQRGRECRSARRRDRGCAERPLELRADLRQRRLDRRDRGGADRAQGRARLAAPDQACGIMRPVRRGAQRRCGGARAADRHARRRRAERSLVHPGAAASLRAGRRADRAGRGAARRAALPALQETAVAHRQRRARRDPARRHARHRLRPESVPARRVPGAALFRRAASLPARAVSPRRLHHRLCRRDRPAAPPRHDRITGCGTGSGSASSISPACGG